MGTYDSSLTRVQPVPKGLVKQDASGLDWLDRLLRLPVRADAGRTAPLPSPWHRLVPPPPGGGTGGIPAFVYQAVVPKEFLA